MANKIYDTMDAGACYINIAGDGGVEAGMVLENGEVLIVMLPVGKNQAEATRKTADHYPAHRLVLERNGNNVVRRASFFGGGDMVDEFGPMVPRGRDYWLGGNR